MPQVTNRKYALLRNPYCTQLVRTMCESFSKESLGLMNSARVRIVVATLLIVASFIPLRLSAQASPVAPRRDVVESVMREAYEKFRNDTRGKNADYIPY